MVLMKCKATIGQLGNVTHENYRSGKAGRKRWLGDAQGSRRCHEPG